MSSLRRHAALALLVILVLLPCGARAQQQPDRSAPPQLALPPSLDLPEIQRFELSNGLPVVLMEKHRVPLVQVNLLVESGEVSDPSGKEGLADMTLAMLKEGAGDRDALALADAIEFLGASIGTRAEEHAATVALHVPLSQFHEALGLLGDVVLRPTFPATELERLRAERLTNLVQAHDEPTAIAPVLFDRTLYGETHPYGVTKQLEADLRSISVEDVQDFYRTHFRPNNATLIVVGDVTPASARPMLEATFGDWTPQPVAPVTVAEAPQVQGRTIYLVDKPGAAQSVIRVGRIGAARDTDDYYALTVMNTILGGSFTSRLNQNLREDKGYSYGAGSRFDFRPAAGPFYATSSVQTDVTGPALAEFMKELEGMLSPVPSEELQRAKNYVALQYPRNFETVSQVAGRLADMVLFDLPETYFDTYTERILAVTQDDVERVARTYLDPENLAIVVVGDRSVVEEQIRALDLGSIDVLTVDDVLGPVPVLGQGSR